MTYYEAIRRVMLGAKGAGAVLLGQINSYRFPDFGLEDFPVCENLMNAVGVGIALTGRQCIVSHDRMDFVTLGIDPIINFAAIQEKAGDLPLVLRLIVGFGLGQGPQHAKNLSHFFQGLNVIDTLPERAPTALQYAIASRELSIFIERRCYYEVRVKEAEHAVCV